MVRVGRRPTASPGCHPSTLVHARYVAEGVGGLEDRPKPGDRAGSMRPRWWPRRTDPELGPKVRDVVGLYLYPPGKAVVPIGQVDGFGQDEGVLQYHGGPTLACSALAQVTRSRGAALGSAAAERAGRAPARGSSRSVAEIESQRRGRGNGWISRLCSPGSVLGRVVAGL